MYGKGACVSQFDSQDKLKIFCLLWCHYIWDVLPFLMGISPPILPLPSSLSPLGCHLGKSFACEFWRNCLLPLNNPPTPNYSSNRRSLAVFKESGKFSIPSTFIMTNYISTHSKDEKFAWRESFHSVYVLRLLCLTYVIILRM